MIAIAILAQAAALVVAAPASQAQQTAVTPVSNASQFATAISNAKPGDTIALADGTYPNLTVGRQFSGLVTIQGSRNAKLGVDQLPEREQRQADRRDGDAARR